MYFCFAVFIYLLVTLPNNKTKKQKFLSVCNSQNGFNLKCYTCTLEGNIKVDLHIVLIVLFRCKL